MIENHTIRRTKIVCTIGPATRSEEMLEKLIKAGMNVARLNFSHENHDSHLRAIQHIRTIAKRLNRPVAILQDLAGPKIRTGKFASGPVHLETGSLFTLTSRDVPGDKKSVSLTYKNLPNDVQPGDALLLSDGALELEVESVKDTDILCRVIVGGPLDSSKGINLPDRSITAPIVSEKDKKDLAFGLKHDVDYVALSFVRCADDVKQVREIINASGKNAQLIAKIEKHEALKNIDDIIIHVDGLMVARGDLGVEIPIEEIPRVQKMLIAKSNAAGKPVITATQMLKSMVESPRPTRAEVTDVANAIFDGTDAVMLSEESAIGQYPVESADMMSRIAIEAESSFPFEDWMRPYYENIPLTNEEAVAFSACQIASRIDAAAITTSTKSGSTTRLVAKYRPAQPILAMTSDEETYRRLALVWGAVPLLMGESSNTDELETKTLNIAIETGYVKKGQTVVLTAGIPINMTGTTNLIKIAKAE